MQPFIYGLFDPTDPTHIRYVGMTRLNALRPQAHWAKRKVKKASHLIHWLRSLEREGRNYGSLVLETLPEHSSKFFVGCIEQCYISALREIGHQLTNVLSGGQGGGCPGYHHTAEARARISESKKRLYADPLQKLANSQRVTASYTPELREIRRKQTLGHTVSAETRAKLSAASKRVAAERRAKLEN